MKTVIVTVALTFFGIVGASAAGCGTHLTAIDTRAVQNQVKLCEAIESHTDAGAILLQAQGCYCGGKGILRRAGVAVPDGGSIACPTN